MFLLRHHLSGFRYLPIYVTESERVSAVYKRKHLYSSSLVPRSAPITVFGDMILCSIPGLKTDFNTDCVTSQFKRWCLKNRSNSLHILRQYVHLKTEPTHRIYTFSLSLHRADEVNYCTETDNGPCSIHHCLKINSLYNLHIPITFTVFWVVTPRCVDTVGSYNLILPSRGNGTESMRKRKLLSHGHCRISRMPTKSQVISPQL